MNLLGTSLCPGHAVTLRDILLLDPQSNTEQRDQGHPSLQLRNYEVYCYLLEAHSQVGLRTVLTPGPQPQLGALPAVLMVPSH